jgi:hypothetical protein
MTHTFNYLADKDVQSIKQGLEDPTSLAQIDADFARLAALAPGPRAWMLDGLESGLVKGFRNTQAGISSLPLVRHVLDLARTQPGMVALIQDDPEIMGLARQLQLEARVLTRVFEAKEGKTGPELAAYVRALGTMTSEDFADPLGCTSRALAAFAQVPAPAREAPRYG